MSIIASSLPNFANRSMLIENIRLSVRSASPSDSTSALSRIEPGVSRINFLVASIKDELLGSSRLGASFADRQASIDNSLSEIGQILRQPLALGGADNAIFDGLNRDQISDIEILALPPNASATFSGGISQQSRSARISIDDASSLLGGGTLDIRIDQREQSIFLRPGISLTGLADRLNSYGVGVSATVTDGRLNLTSRGSSSLEATVRPRHTSRSMGQSYVSGLNSEQISDVDISSLPAGISQTLTGTRDAVAEAASLTYTGNVEAQVSGSVTFDLTGRLGTANLSAMEGESLSSFATRINDASSTTGVLAEVSGDELRFVSNTRGDAAEVRITNIAPQYEKSVQGVNENQIDRFDLLSIADNITVTLEGEITQTADSAALQYHGGTGGVVVDSASFTITGNIGSSQIAIIQNESLADVRDRINSQTESTGVVASLDGETIEFRSQDVGSLQSVSVTLDDIAQYVDVAGVNAAQVSDFTVLSSQPRSTNTLSGSVTRVATQGELSYASFLGSSTSNATFTLTGELGSAEIQVGFGESISSIRDSINTVSDQTGVTADVDLFTLNLTSANYGSGGIVQVDVQSGSFNTSGGDGNGNAAGLDTQLEINGDIVTADGYQVAYADALGSYSFEVNQGFVGAFDPITVTTTDGDFDVTGGNEFGTAYGIDAEATINGQDFVAAGHLFDLAIDSASVSFDVAASFVGAIDPITLRSTPSDFSITGGDGNGFATGNDGIATVDGVEYRSVTDTFDVNVGDNAIQIAFANDYVGEFDDIRIQSDSTVRRRTGSATTYRSGPRHQRAEINGQAFSRADGRYEIEQDGVRIAFRVAEGFAGDFDSFTVAAGGQVVLAPLDAQSASLSEQSLTVAQTALGSLFQLASGGNYSSNQATSFDAYLIAVDALTALQSATGTAIANGRSLGGTVLDTFA